MYWYVLILTVQPGYASLRLDSLLQFCQANSVVLETSASNDSNASSSMFQSRLPCFGAGFAPTPPGPRGGRRRRRRLGRRRLDRRRLDRWRLDRLRRGSRSGRRQRGGGRVTALEAPASGGAASGAGAALTLKLPIKFLATGRPPAPVLMRKVL